LESNTKYGPYLLYFLSVDIIDSTSYKSSRKEKKESSSSWSISFNSFFVDVDHYLNQAYQKIEKEKLTNFQALSKWRVIGDEIVYFSQITNLKHLEYHIKATIDFATKFNQSSKQDLKVKLTSWIAGFPVNNAMYYETADKKLRAHGNYKIRSYKEINFLGPCIDTGFRISKFASCDKYIISIDLALVLLHYIDTKENRYSHFRFFFDSEQEVKGVNGGSYPILWLNLKEKDSSEFKLEKKGPCNKNELLKYCDNYIEKNNLYKPFVFGEDHTYFKYSNYYENEFKKVVKILNSFDEIESGNDEDSKDSKLNTDTNLF
jgi:hypothetical protein